MDTVARMSSKGQITVPKAVRDALGLSEGDELIFHLHGTDATITRAADFLGLAGSVAVPAARRNASWDDVIRRTRAIRANQDR